MKALVGHIFILFLILSRTAYSAEINPLCSYNVPGSVMTSFNNLTNKLVLRFSLFGTVTQTSNFISNSKTIDSAMESARISRCRISKKDETYAYIDTMREACTDQCMQAACRDAKKDSHCTTIPQKDLTTLFMCTTVCDASIEQYKLYAELISKNQGNKSEVCTNSSAINNSTKNINKVINHIETNNIETETPKKKTIGR